MSEMKECEIQWIPEIPNDWKVLRGKSILQLLKRSPDSFMEVITCFRDGEVTLRKNRREEGFTFSDKEIGYQGICNGDLVIHGMDGFAGAIGISDSDGKGSPVLVVCDSNENKKYLVYYLRMLATQNVFVAMATGIRERSCDLRWNKIADLLFPIPPVSEQNKIVDYLDEKCAKIDAVIEKQKQVIEKLKEYKLSVITEAVTKGLDPTVPMKDSGVEWIGEIPEEWSTQRMKSCLHESMQYGALETGIEYSTDLPRYIRITDITADGNLKVDNRLSLPYDNAKNYLLEDGDVLFARSGGTVGKTFIYKKEYGLCAFAGYLIKAKCNSDKLLPKFLYYYTLSNSYDLWKNYIFIQATIQNIGADKYSNMPIVVPTIIEQTEIIHYLDKQCYKIDLAMAKKQSIVEKLTEYKKSLIYEVVTGKKEV